MGGGGRSSPARRGGPVAARPRPATARPVDRGGCDGQYTLSLRGGKAPEKPVYEEVRDDPASTPTEPCVIKVRGQDLDVTRFLSFHPGGDVIRQFHRKEAMEAFQALHGEAAFAKLTRMMGGVDPRSLPVPAAASGSAPDVQRAARIQADFQVLRSDLEAQGMFESNKLWYLYKSATTLALLALGVYWTLTGSIWWGAVAMGVYWQQAGWLAHDYLHHQVFENRSLNYLVGNFLGNFTEGFSSKWWQDRHNTHHALTNVIDNDPDIDNAPLLLWNHIDVERLLNKEGMGGTLFRMIAPYQKYYFLPLISFLRIIWILQSVAYAFTYMRSTHIKPVRSLFWKELLPIVGHFVWVSALLYYSMPSAAATIGWLLVSELIGGLGIGAVVYCNHTPLEYFPVEYGLEEHEQHHKSFAQMQLEQTRNVSPGYFMDWFCGGLNYQIEHHMFPQMPRHNYWPVSKQVREFCDRHDLEYDCIDFLPAIFGADGYLAKLGRVSEQFVKLDRKVHRE